jgi:hypothetical protein
MERYAATDGIGDAPCTVASYPIPDFAPRDPIGAVVDRFKLACWGTMLVLSGATIMTIVTAHWALGTSGAMEALRRARAMGRRRAGAGRTAAAGAPLPRPARTLTRRRIYDARGVRWEPPLAETA